MPEGMERHNDGWTLSVRVRLVHARIRQILNKSDEWDIGEWGTPVSAAHCKTAVASFSARLLRYIEKLGVSLKEKQRKTLTGRWQHSGNLTGIPETILFKNKQDSHGIFRIGNLCRTPTSLDSTIMTDCLINVSPLFAGLTEQAERRRILHDLPPQEVYTMNDRRITFGMRSRMTGENQVDAVLFTRSIIHLFAISVPAAGAAPLRTLTGNWQFDAPMRGTGKNGKQRT